ncbi:MAG: hypothetical protein F4169_20515 [Gammaproteobacteria bacterium]|nr:hypothetical protein [Gammaproteobacteria bacterium]
MSDTYFVQLVRDGVDYRLAAARVDSDTPVVLYMDRDHALQIAAALTDEYGTGQGEWSAVPTSNGKETSW